MTKETGETKDAPLKSAREPNVCPECRHAFQGNGWDGIDAHWKAKHQAIMPYKDAWPLIQAGIYTEAKR